MSDDQNNPSFKHHLLKGTAPVFFKSLAHKIVRQAPKDDELTIKLVVKQKDVEHDLKALRSMSLEERKKEFSKKYSIQEDHLEKLKVFAETHGLKIIRINHHLGKVTLTGKVQLIEKIFDVSLHYFNHDKRVSFIKHNAKEYLGHLEDIKIPEELRGIVDHVLGLSHSPMHHTAPTADPLKLGSYQAAAYGVTSSYFANEYGFPEDYLGKGQKIAVISCGGGYKESDLDAYFLRAGIPKPKISFKSVDNHTNSPGGSWMYDYEMSTDILVAACAAYEAEIIVYFTKNSVQGFADAVEAIMEDENGPSVISYSWGSSEDAIANRTILSVNRVLEYATLVSQITILCSSGDKGANNNFDYSDSSKTPTEPMIQFPSSSPWITSCGGTMYRIQKDENGNEVSRQEEVWNSVNLYSINYPTASGGGFSTVFNQPAYQDAARKNAGMDEGNGKRSIPDIAGHADLSPDNISYWVLVDGQPWLTGGTSSVAPLMAALIARFNQALESRVGFFNNLLYEMEGTEAISSITSGNNSMYGNDEIWPAQQGYDCCTGLGIPNGNKMLEFLRDKWNKNVNAAAQQA